MYPSAKHLPDPASYISLQAKASATIKNRKKMALNNWTFAASSAVLGIFVSLCF
jgi:hypothetical protein